AGALAVAGAAVALRPWPDPLLLSRPVEAVCAVAVAALAVSLWPAPAREPDPEPGPGTGP
ncbi:MAG: hypothetical protein JWN17_212, partial [Frankiales bacterium]|nr:hypothetical protein [Frankiales bacterium]